MRVMIGWVVTLGAVLVVSQAEAQVAVSEVWRHPDTGDFYALPTNDDSAGRVPAVHVSDNNGQSWSRLPGVPDGAGGELATRTFAIIPGVGGTDILFAGTDSDGLFRSIDGGTTWTIWNDAAIGIKQISVADRTGEAAWVVALDGAVYVSLDDGANWTLVSGIAAITVTAIVNGGDDIAWVGTDTGDLIELASAGTAITFLTGGTPFGGAITALARTVNGTLFIGVDEFDPDGSHLYRTDSVDLTSFVELQRNGESLHLRGLTAVDDSIHLLEYLEQVIYMGTGEPLDYLVTSDNGLSYAGKGVPPRNANQIFVGPCVGCEPWVLIAHTEGLFLKGRVGIGWNVLGDVEEPFVPPPPPPPTTTNADLGVRMISPAQSAGQIADSSRRFEIEVSNRGPENVSGVIVEIEFATWVDIGLVLSPTSSWGEAATIAGQDCERGFDSFADEILLCRLDVLSSGESASIVLTQTLPDKTFMLRIDAEVSASFNVDRFSNNDWIVYKPSVVAGQAPVSQAGGSGGGGSLGFLTLLGLLAVAVRGAMANRGLVRSVNDGTATCIYSPQVVALTHTVRTIPEHPSFC